MSERRFPAPAPTRHLGRDADSSDNKSRKNQENDKDASRHPRADRDADRSFSKETRGAAQGKRREKKYSNNNARTGGARPDSAPHGRAQSGRDKFRAKDLPEYREDDTNNAADGAGTPSGAFYGTPPRALSGPGAEAAENPEDRTLQPGMKPVLELLENDPSRVDAVFLRKGRRGKETDRILDLCRKAGVRFSLVDDAALARLWKGNHQGVIARLFSAGFTDLETALETAAEAPLPLLLAFDQVQDPGNAGAMARTLYALGGAGIILPRHNSVYLGAAAAKAAAGALDRLAVVKVANLGQALDAAAKAGFAIYGTAVSAPEGVLLENAFDVIPDFPAVLVLGGEEGGIRPLVARRCRSFLQIPLGRDFDSLNVAQAGAVIMGFMSGKI